MSQLKIETAENGFVVYEDAGMGLHGKKWAFESAQALSEFMLNWGQGMTKVQDSNEITGAVVAGHL